MSQVTDILAAIEQGDAQNSQQLLPLVYDELRQLAAQKLSHEAPGQTLQPTALVHEAYLRLIDCEQPQQWNSRGHFFAAAAEAMRRILIENARRKQADKHGGKLRRCDVLDVESIAESTADNLQALDEALEALSQHDAIAAQLVKLRLYAGLSVEQVGKALGMSRAAAYRLWVFARAWLQSRLTES